MSNLALTKKENYVPVLDKSVVKEYICPLANDKEIHHFLELCKAQNLNPFIREVYLVKYSANAPASMVVGKEVFLKRAMRNPRFKGYKITLLGEGSNMQARCEVSIEGLIWPIEVTVDYVEYVNKKSDGTPNKFWKEKPKTMLRKVALVQALREAFPEDFGGMYSQEEMNTIDDNLPTEAINITPEINHSEILESCRTIEELKEKFKSFSFHSQKEFEEIKNEMKKKLSQPEVDVMTGEIKEFDFKK